MRFPKQTTFDYNTEKSRWLKKTRGIGFEDVIALIDADCGLRVYAHPNRTKYAHQGMIELEVDGYTYLIPFVMSEQTCFLKTIYPSRKATRKLRKSSS